MSIAGWTNPNYGSGWVFYGWNTDNNVGAYVAMAEDGTISAVSFNCAALAGSGSGMVAQGCVWDTAGNLLGAGGGVALPYIGQQHGPYAWQTSGGLSLAVAQGQTILIGWWRSPQQAAGDCMWGYGGGGTEWRGTTANSSGAGPFGADASDSRQVGVYVTYTPSTAPPTPPPAPVVVPASTLPIEQLVEQRHRRLIP